MDKVEIQRKIKSAGGRAAVGREIGVTPQMVGLVIRGKRKLRPDKALRLAEIIGIPVELVVDFMAPSAKCLLSRQVAA